MKVETNHPINDTIDDLHAAFESNYRLNAFDAESMAVIFKDEVMKDKYLGTLMTDVSEESERAVITSQIERSLNYRVAGSINPLIGDPFAEEGFDVSTQPGTNQGALDGYLPVTILGYNAQSSMLEIYNSVTHEKRDYPIQFEIKYAIKSNATSKDERKIFPKAVRDGSVAGMLDSEMVTLQPTPGTPGASHISLVGGVPYIEVAKSGNVLTESGKNIHDWGLSDNIVIDNVRYDDRADMTTGTAAPKIVNVAARAGVKGYDGDLVSARIIEVQADLTLDDNSVVTDYFTFHIDRDTGDYRSTGSMTGRILGFSVTINILNLMNAAETVKMGRDIITARIVAKPRRTLSMPIPMDTVGDQFSAVEGGVTDMAKYAADKFAIALASVNDIDMENHMIGNINAAIANPEVLQRFIAYPKLGGFIGNEQFDVTKRGPGGSRPLSWMNEGIKDMTNNLLTLAETDTEYTEAVDREWVFLGYMNDIKRFVDVQYNSETSGALTKGTRYGFAKHIAVAYSDSFGHRVKLIGSTDVRHRTRGGSTGQVFGFLRSNAPDLQPSGIYYGYDFRIVKGIDPKNSVHTISFWVHDVWDVLALAAVRIDLINPVNAINAIVDSSLGN